MKGFYCGKPKLLLPVSSFKAIGDSCKNVSSISSLSICLICLCQNLPCFHVYSLHQNCCGAIIHSQSIMLLCFVTVFHIRYQAFSFSGDKCHCNPPLSFSAQRINFSERIQRKSYALISQFLQRPAKPQMVTDIFLFFRFVQTKIYFFTKPLQIFYRIHADLFLCYMLSAYFVPFMTDLSSM